MIQTFVPIPTNRPSFIDETGNPYGRLIVQGYLGQGKHGLGIWLCLCSCGNETIAKGALLRDGRIQSCGCMRRDPKHQTHGMSYTAVYNIWLRMKQRCSDKATGDARIHYFERGIKVCGRWLESFENFYADMGDRPEGMSIERKNNNLGYFPDNCIWATVATQARNKRSNVNITFQDRTQTQMDWAIEYGIPYYTLRRRLSMGWSIERSLTTAIRKYTAKDILVPTH